MNEFSLSSKELHCKNVLVFLPFDDSKVAKNSPYSYLFLYLFVYLFIYLCNILFDIIYNLYNDFFF